MLCTTIVHDALTVSQAVPTELAAVPSCSEASHPACGSCNHYLCKQHVIPGDAAGIRVGPYLRAQGATTCM